MDAKKKIVLAVMYSDKKKYEIAEGMDISKSGLSQVLKRGNIQINSAERLAEAIGARFYWGFEFPDGTKIE